MNKVLAVTAASLFLGAAIVGCGKKDAGLESQDSLSMSTLNSLPAEGTAAQPAAPVAPDAKAPAPKPEVAVEPAALGPAGQEGLPPQGPFKPTTQDIQQALKTAGYYFGEVDGKAGPKTKKAIEEFQKANNIKVDGKVGPQTWNLLSQNIAQPAAAKKKQ